MTNDDVTRDLPEGTRCLWQLCPNELPKDAPTMALELYQLPDGKLTLFQLFCADRRPDWYQRVDGFARFDHSR